MGRWPMSHLLRLAAPSGSKKWDMPRHKWDERRRASASELGAEPMPMSHLLRFAAPSGSKKWDMHRQKWDEVPDPPPTAPVSDAPDTLER
ncbi:hypothetical protein RKD05_000551 [Microbacterium sp. SLBN-111]